MVNSPPAITWVRFLGWEGPLEAVMQPTSMVSPGESQEQRSMAGYIPWFHKEGRRSADRLSTAHSLSLDYISIYHYTVVLSVSGSTQAKQLLVNICSTHTLKVCIGMCACVIQGKIKENWYVFCYCNIL